ncbi:MAG: Methyltransferase type 11 [Candidatus Uhrbacteria bacterium GW2011_GWF2_41_16]|uniref:Methyltransferase type 11 n=1 Tax=Candidatus Uhrbacteria bacterium GW2011_GWF2_41_16 TaxID=1618997 RepID=A0A0G0VA41_9BACT|nr:MAG: Methyltransferase type 11 [Candidatus Uhrbacteria bacterium GW2011_GWF2_41_16]
MSNVFDRYWKEYDAWYDKHKFAYLSELAAIKKVLPKKGKGLEIGIGTGRFAALLGIQYGIDPSANMVRIAKKRKVNARVGYGQKLPYRDSAFDYVAIINTLCFVKNPEQVLRESWRVLKKNGKIIVGIIDKNNFLGKFYKRKKSIFYKRVNFFSCHDMFNLLKLQRFNHPISYQTIFDFPVNMASIQKPKKGYGEGGFVVFSARKIGD